VNLWQNGDKFPLSLLDGESHTEATFGKDKAKDVPYLVATEDGSKDDAVFGFTSEDAMELWTRDNGLIEHYEKLNELQTRAHRQLSPQETDRVFRISNPDSERCNESV
jgi:hypothetical protein